MLTFSLEVRRLLRCKRHKITPSLIRRLIDKRAIIRTGWHPVKLGAITRWDLMFVFLATDIYNSRMDCHETRDSSIIPLGTSIPAHCSEYTTLRSPCSRSPVGSRPSTLEGRSHRHHLGWLTVIESMKDRAEELRTFAASAKRHGIRDVVLLGMGGSSLGSEVLRASLLLTALRRPKGNRISKT